MSIGRREYLHIVEAERVRGWQCRGDAVSEGEGIGGQGA